MKYKDAWNEISLYKKNVRKFIAKLICEAASGEAFSYDKPTKNEGASVNNSSAN